ncbi:MAG: glutathione peroxidase [Saprospiraceae bacterium]|nr:glutathione peroxidase [Saprospiraceae bacterium]
MTVLPDFHSFTIPLLDGGVLSFESLRGKFTLVVNVASECGFTPQYRQLQELYANHHDQVQIIGLPCNDFGGQEPGTPEEILSFCDQRYQVTFPLTEKVNITTEPVHPMIQWLTLQQYNGVQDYPVKWNFTKFLISPEGVWMGGYGCTISPFDDNILDKLGLTTS